MKRFGYAVAAFCLAGGALNFWVALAFNAPLCLVLGGVGLACAVWVYSDARTR